MRPAAIALIVCCFTQAALAAVQHFPLIVIESGGLAARRPDIPIISVGTLPDQLLPALAVLPQPFTTDTQPRWDTFPDVNPDAINAIADGKIKFAGPVAGRTVLLLAAPFLNIRKCWLPAELTLENKTVTLDVTAWDGDDNAATGKNGEDRAAYLLSLAALPAGDYILQFHCTHLAEQPDHRYLPCQNDDASIPFTIAAAGENSITPATLPESAIKSAAIAPNPALSEFAPPIHWARADSLAVASDPEFQVGTLDAYKVMEEFHEHDRLPPPRVQANPASEYPRENLVALINPHIQSGDFIQLRDVQFHGDEITITADDWQDLIPRAAVVPQSPFLRIPLNFVPAGRHRIALDWHIYQTMDSRPPYTEAPPAGQFKPITIDFTVK
jgi:hypothetical protein